MLTIICGVPGSGKSTYVKRVAGPMTTIVCPDSIRKELTGSESDQSLNDEVFRVAYKRTADALGQGRHVIFDATNLTKKTRKTLIDIAWKTHCKAVYFDVPLAVCLERNAKRDRHVPEEVIRRMFTKYEHPTTSEGFVSCTRIAG